MGDRVTGKISTSRQFFDMCADGLFDRSGGNQAYREANGVRVGLRLVRGSEPRVEESYAVVAPWNDTWGDAGEVTYSTPVPRALLSNPEAAAVAVRGVRGRVDAMATLSAIARVSVEVVAGRDTRFGELELPGDFMDWVTIGVWAKVLEDGPLRSDGVQSLLYTYTLAVQNYFSKTRRGVWAGQRGVPRSADLAVTTGVCMSVMVTMGLQR